MNLGNNGSKLSTIGITLPFYNVRLARKTDGMHHNNIHGTSREWPSQSQSSTRVRISRWGRKNRSRWLWFSKQCKAWTRRGATIVTSKDGRDSSWRTSNRRTGNVKRYRRITWQVDGSRRRSCRRRTRVLRIEVVCSTICQNRQGRTEKEWNKRQNCWSLIVLHYFRGCYWGLKVPN